MQFMNLLKTILFLNLSIGWISSANADLYLEITSGNDAAVPIAIVPFVYRGTLKLSENPSDTIVSNFSRTGEFAPLEEEDLIAKPTEMKDIAFSDWRLINTRYILIGKITQVKAEFLIQYELFDAIKQERILAEQVKATNATIRSRAHFISDRVYETLTSRRGVFSTKIAYVTATPRKGVGKYLFKLYVADSDGRRAKAVLTSNEPVLSPDWSPDGKKIAYVSFEKGRPGIFVQDVTTGKRYMLSSFVGLNGAPSWSPDGKKIAMTLSKDGNAEIYVYNIPMKRLTRMTNHYAIDTEPSWSPDGKKIVFTSGRGGAPQVYEMEVATRKVERVSYQGNYNARPRYSPDGKEIFMVHRQKGYFGFNIAALDVRSKKLRILTNTKLDESPSVAPNGTMVIYAMKKGSKVMLGVVAVASKLQYQLPSADGDVREPAWSPYLN